MYNYCTLFDSKYLTRGLAMYESLKEHTSHFHLYVFAFDSLSYKMLKRLDLESLTVISLEEFEDEELLRVKNTRSSGEYCWTCTPSTIKYCIEHYNLENCTYLDADLYFFSDPSVLIEEMGDKSVLITEHRYTPKYDQSITSGLYCVQFMTFKNNNNGMKILNWWKDACIEWCYDRHEDGKFGDQKYLDDWLERFEEVHVLESLGGGVAPWNVQRYSFVKTEDNVLGLENNSQIEFELVFYHFHSYKILTNDRIDCCTYKLNSNIVDIIYKPYAKHLSDITERLTSLDAATDYNGIIKQQPFHWKQPLRIFKRYINGTYNIYTKEELLGE